MSAIRRQPPTSKIQRAEIGGLGLVKTDSAPWRLVRSDELLNRFEHYGELLVVFLFERFDLAGKIAVGVHEPSELHERSHDRNIYLDRASAPEDARKHGDALLREGVWTINSSAVFARAHHKL